MSINTDRTTSISALSLWLRLCSLSQIDQAAQGQSFTAAQAPILLANNGACRAFAFFYLSERFEPHFN